MKTHHGTQGKPRVGNPTEADEVITTVRLPKDHHEALRRIATQEHRSLSGQLRVVVEGYLAERPPLGEAA